MFESVLKRVLQAVFGGGADVDSRSILDGLQSIALEHRLERSLNDFFNGKIRPVVGDPRKIDVDSYWTSSGLTLPAGNTSIGLYTRKLFSYPIVSVVTILPTLTVGRAMYIGAEVGSGSGAGIPWVALHEATDGKAYLGMIGRGGTVGHLEITSLLPADYDTALHTYTLMFHRCNVELYINGVLKAIALMGLPQPIPSWEDNPPYAIGSYEINTHRSIFLFVELMVTTAPPPMTLPIDITENRLIASDGHLLPPRQYVVCTENTATKWRALATAGDVLTSHPVPVWGYPTKTLVFQADAAGNLDIQVYTGGGWRSWVPGGITLVANQLEVYNLNGEIPIARCVYTPTNADTITLAEWYLS